MSTDTTEHLPTLTIITFALGSMHCGLPLEDIDEIKRVFTLTRVHKAPAFVCGVVNLRGRIVTVIDACIRMGIDSDILPHHRKLIITHNDDEQIGLLVDSINDTLTIPTSAKVPPPSNIEGSVGMYIKSVCTTPDDLISILDKELLVSVPVPHQDAV